MLCQIEPKGKLIYKRWLEVISKVFSLTKEEFVGWRIWWILRAQKFKICRNHWMDKRSCHSARCHESDVRCYLIQVGLAIITTEFSPETRVIERFYCWCAWVRPNGETVCHSCLGDTFSGLVFSHQWLLSLWLDTPKKISSHTTQWGPG